MYPVLLIFHVITLCQDKCPFKNTGFENTISARVMGHTIEAHTSDNGETNNRNFFFEIFREHDGARKQAKSETQVVL